MTTPAIRTESLTRLFGRTRAIDRLSLEIPEGCIVAVLGPNGAGKSTLFRLLLGLLEPTARQCVVFGHDPRTTPPGVLQRISGLCDRHEPPGRATLGRLLDLQACASSLFDRTFAEYLCTSHGLRTNAPYRSLSKGQRRWALLAVTLASRADLLLFDEPCDGLDPSARRELYDYVREYATQRNATVLVSTHVISDIERVADDVVLIRHGRLVLHAGIEELRDRVREIEFPGVHCLPELSRSVRVLGRQFVNDSTLAWVIGDDPDAVACEECSGVPAKVRMVNLETLYLALTEHSLDFVPAREGERR